MDALAVQSTWGAALGRRLVRRSRLLEAITRSGSRTVLLVAPAGYGKTTLSRQWRDETAGAWIGLSSASADVPVLARELGGALHRTAGLDPDRIEAALSAAKAPLEQAKTVARTILAHTHVPLDAWIVIDDYHVLSGNRSAEELVALLVHSGRFKLLVASRVRPSWATSRQRVHLETLEIGRSEMALDDDEVAELIPSSRETEALKRQAQGWPAVIGLAAHADSTSLPPDVSTLSARLYDYLAEELYDHASGIVRSFLTTLAVLPPLELAELDEVLNGADAGERAAATGLAYESDGRIIVHPLARAFLRSKLRAEQDAAEVVAAAFDLSVARGLYDEAFELVQDFKLSDRLETLITAAYGTLVETGRIATLETFGTYAEAHGDVPQWLLDLIAAEVALRDGRFENARTFGKAAGEVLPTEHPLRARCYVIAGSAAHLMHRFGEALELHSQASECAMRNSDSNDAAWGKCLAALISEDVRTRIFLRELESLPSPRASDRARTAVARIRFALLADTSGLRGLDFDTRRVPLAGVTDPWVRSGWSNTYGYALMLQGRYEEAREVLRAALSELRELRLAFGTPHVELSLAASELGLRHFGRSDALVRSVENGPAFGRDAFMQVNARMLRARLALAQLRPDDAVALTVDDFEDYSSLAMHGEYLATRALALSAAGELTKGRLFAEQAETITRAIDSRIICRAVQTLTLDDDAVRVRATVELLDAASLLGIWDGLICCARALPDLLRHLSEVPQHRVELREVLLRSNDVALAKSIGLASRSSGPRGVLSPREREVLDQVRQGRTNAEIGSTLFISPGTVKRHMDHIFDKLGVRTRAAAVARYAEIETTGVDSDSASTAAS